MLESSGRLLPFRRLALLVLAARALLLRAVEAVVSRDRLAVWFCSNCSSEGSEAAAVSRRALEAAGAAPADVAAWLTNPSIEVASAPAESARVTEVAEGCGCSPDCVVGRLASEGVSAGEVVVARAAWVRLRRACGAVASAAAMDGAAGRGSVWRCGASRWIERGWSLAVASGAAVAAGRERAEVSAGRMASEGGLA